MTEPTPLRAATAPTPKPPAGLKSPGRALWRRLAAAYTFDAGELALLELVARQADDIAALDALIAVDGMVVMGSQGQPRLNAAITEVRQGRLALGKLLAQLALPDDDDRPSDPATKRARHAAEARWIQEGRKAEMRDRAHRGPA